MSGRKISPSTSRSLSAIAKAVGVTRETIRRWRDAGVNVNDPAELSQRVAESRSARQDTGELSQARLEKIRLESEKLQIQIDLQRGQLVARADVEEALTHLGAAVKAAIMRLEADLPPMMEGMAPSKMQLTIRQKIDEILGMLADEQSTFWEDHPTEE